MKLIWLLWLLIMAFLLGMIYYLYSVAPVESVCIVMIGEIAIFITCLFFVIEKEREK